MRYKIILRPKTLLAGFWYISILMLPLTCLSQKADSTVTVAAGEQYQKNWFHRFLWGGHYRKVWAEPVEVPLLWLKNYRGGLTPIKQGGSFQTKNLRLEDSLGREYVLRSIDKDATKALPKFLQNTFVGALMRDQTSVIHPYGAFIVPELAHAAGVYHTNPVLVFIPDDPALGKFQEAFANTLALLEERPDDEDWQGLESFGRPANIVSSRKAMEEMLEKPTHQVTASQYLKSRLFDMWLSDWSRREDQWRWGVVPGQKVIYEPIPRDRDHAFFKFDDGLITSLVTLFKPNYQTFDHDIDRRDVKGLMRASQRMDSYLLAYLSKEDFLAVARQLQQDLTDNVIEAAIAQWPPQIRELTGEEFRTKLKSRRQDLAKAAAHFYSQINHEVKLPGTDEKDIFEVQFQEDGSLRVQHWSNINDQPNVLLGQKTFYPSETESIAIFGLGKEDHLKLTGQGRNKIELKWYGGEGADELKKADGWKITGKKIILYDEEDGNEYKKGDKLKIKDYTPQANEFKAEGWLLRHRLH